MPHQFPIDRYLNVRAATSPSFSPDGRFVAYISNTTGIPQVWLIPADGGEPTQLTFGSDAVRGVHFSPIKHELIFSMDHGGDEHTQLYRVFGIGGNTDHGIGDGWDFENLTNEPKSIHTFGGWSHDGAKIAYAANREDASRFDIYVQDVASGEKKSGPPKLVAKGPGGYYTAAGWSPDDKDLLIIHTDSNVNQDLYLIEVESAQIRHLTPHQGDVQFHSPVWSHDGKTIFCCNTAPNSDLARVMAIEVAPKMGAMTFFKNVPHEAEWIASSTKTHRILVSKNEHGKSAVDLFDPKNQEVVSVQLPLGVASAAEFSRDGKRIALAIDGPRNNPNIWLWDLAANPARELTHSGRAGLPFEEFIQPQLVRYKTFDGKVIFAWWYPAPASGDELPPVIVYPHGGPESQTRPNFTALFQYFRARGYAILAPNVRGSSGYGTAFMNLDNTTKRMESVADLAHAVYWLRDEKKGDPKRIAVYGGSYGGFMVLAAVTNYPDLWAAGIDVVGICNFVTFLEKTGAYRRSHREKEYGNLREHREFLERISPIHHADKIKCPMMVIHGANDPRVPIGEAEQIVAALKKRGIPVEYLRYEDEGHGLVKLKNRLDAYPKMAEFLDRYVKK
jgi:dipeptidyl aminopeptidase/acylaminoacyl peptidase